MKVMKKKAAMKRRAMKAAAPAKAMKVMKKKAAMKRRAMKAAAAAPAKAMKVMKKKAAMKRRAMKAAAPAKAMKEMKKVKGTKKVGASKVKEMNRAQRVRKRRERPRGDQLHPHQLNHQSLHIAATTPTTL